jgi:hypothetical protein
MLLNNGGNPNAKNRLGEPLLFETVRDTGVLWDNFNLLLSKGDLNATDKSGDNVVMYIAGTNRFQEVEQILNQYGDKLNLNQKNDLNATLAYLVQESLTGQKTKQGEARKKVKVWLENKGIKFPVKLLD